MSTYNNLQLIASNISGYDQYSGMSARDDGYYDCDTKEEKLAYIICMGNCGMCGEAPVSVMEAEKIYNFLEFEFDGICEKEDAFEELV